MMRQSRALPPAGQTNQERVTPTTIKAYRSTRYSADRTPKQHKPQPKRTGSIWGVTWTTEDFDDDNWDAMPGRRQSRR